MARKRLTRSSATLSKAKVAEPEDDKQSELSDGLYDVETILDKRQSQEGLVEYYVKWKNYPNSSNTWEPAENIFSEDLIRDFESKRAKKGPGQVDFKKLKDLRPINQSTLNKSMTFQAKFDNQPVVVRLEKTQFVEDDARKLLLDKNTNFKMDQTNDIYSAYDISPAGSNKTTEVRASVVWPANDGVLKKYSHSETMFFSESPEVYNRVVAPFIQHKVTSSKSDNQWVFNILDGKAEKDRIILNDTDKKSGFVLLPSFKSAGKGDDLDFVAICHRRDIYSLRDLNGQHLTLLRNILTKSTKAIQDAHKKSLGRLRAYIHYHPTFYHFHVHIKMVDPCDYQATDRDHLLSTVISNLSIDENYYSKAVLTYPLSINSDLYDELKKKKRLNYIF